MSDSKIPGRPGRLYIVATPIGNLGDLSERARRILCQAPLIAAEDTRRTAVLLRHIGSAASVSSYHEHSKTARRDRLLDHLCLGKDLALVSDAGTPLISDPGYRLVTQAIAEQVDIIAVPGPAAVIAALSVAGLPTDRFAFEGFPPGRGRAHWLRRIGAEPRTLVLYETPNRLPGLLQELRRIVGDERRAALVYELTKVHERVVRGRLGELAASAAASEPALVKGELVVVLEGAQEAPAVADSDALLRCLLELCSPSEAARRAAALTGQPRSRLYDRVRQLHRAGQPPADE